jgi:ATP-dependent RNA helicase DeaD
VLPSGMPADVLAHLQKVWVRGKALQLRPDDGETSSIADSPPRKRKEARGDAPESAKKPKAKHRKGAEKRKKKSSAE